MPIKDKISKVCLIMCSYNHIIIKYMRIRMGKMPSREIIIMEKTQKHTNLG